MFNQKKLDRDNPIASLTLPDGNAANCAASCLRKWHGQHDDSQAFKQSFFTGRLCEFRKTQTCFGGLSDEIQPWEAELLQLVQRAISCAF
ncbi:hypothetical protein LOK82_13610 [Xylella fastidiosa subsp. multiplex]|uniref:Uncharacterized protein n=1 Tax=Xylella fastidiosa subsp. multiplex TaxID=644357 RepID=A0AAW6HYM7_XYLFS|nr:hypothetical protein [Xylella fastidiosa subsp. multiplex]